jgi:hypothetical protein
VSTATGDPVGQMLEVRSGSLDLDSVARLGLWLAAAESNSADPKAKGMAAALRIAYAERLGLPAHAAQEIHLIKGNLTLSAKLCRALAHQHGLRVVPVNEKADSCTAAVVDTSTGKELGRRTFTLAMAKQRGLSGTNWTNAPERMLWARASKMALDDLAPWVTVGVLSEEQVEDFSGEPIQVADAEVIPPDDEVPFGEDA